MFLLSIYQYLYLAVIYSKGAPYRKAIFSNKFLCLVLSVCFIVSVSFLLASSPTHSPCNFPKADFARSNFHSQIVAGDGSFVVDAMGFARRCSPVNYVPRSGCRMNAKRIASLRDLYILDQFRFHDASLPFGTQAPENSFSLTDTLRILHTANHCLALPDAIDRPSSNSSRKTH